LRQEIPKEADRLHTKLPFTFTIMRNSAVLLAFSSMVALVTTQYSIDPTTIDPAVRAQWCSAQQTSCPLICLQLPGASGLPESNSCDPGSLSYQCVCSNGATPNASQYTQTIPYFLCTEFDQECIKNCTGGSSTCQAACTQNNPCGAQNPTRVNSSSTTSTTGATGSPTGSSSGTGTGIVYEGFASSTNTAKSVAAARAIAFEFGQLYGLGVVFASLFAGFAIIL